MNRNEAEESEGNCKLKNQEDGAFGKNVRYIEKLLPVKYVVLWAQMRYTKTI